MYDKQMLGEGIGALIPKKTDEDNVQKSLGDQEDIEFVLPDVSHGKKSVVETVGDELMEAPPTKIVKFKEPVENEEEKPGRQNIFHIEVNNIESNPHQPRRDFDEGALRDLANSIREFGIIQPLVVTKIEQPTEVGQKVSYQLIAGERRLKASRMLGLPTVPVVIRNVVNDVEKLELAVIENIQRADLNPIESGRAMARLQDEFGMTQREIASRLGKSREVISNTVRLLSLPSDVQNAIIVGEVSESQGRLLLSLEDPGMQQEVFEQLSRKNMTIRELENHIRRIKGRAMKHSGVESNPLSHNPELMALSDRLEELLGTKVDVRRDGSNGKIIINFYSQEELDSVVGKLFKQSDNQSL
jgi:ParB family transcriptional regulator, chromosome partitioning protein